jgi:co-chaperonin GroES (HSP10)
MNNSQLSKMGGKVAQYHAIKGKLIPIKNNVIIEDMNFGERVTDGGIIIASDDGQDEGIKARWGRVYAKGPDNKDDYNVGDWILIDHGRWSRGVDVEDPDTGQVVKLRRADPKDVLAVSDEEPTEVAGSIKTFVPANPMTVGDQ